MNEPLPKNLKRVASRGGWRSFFLHALAMFIATWPVFILVQALATSKIPVSLRAVAMSCAEATGYYLIPLIFSWIALRFNKIAGWVVWFFAVGFFAWGQFSRSLSI